MNLWRVYGRKRFASFEDLKIWRVYGHKLKNNDVGFDEKRVLDTPKQPLKVILDDFQKKEGVLSGYGWEVRERKREFSAKKV